MSVTVTAEYHEGPVRVSFHDKRYLVTCPLGHVVTGGALGADWPGSFTQARIGSHQSGAKVWVERCEGAIA
jgi:hypothetical protein